MTLGEYLFWKNISFQEFATRIGVSRPLISAIVNGTRRPKRSLAKLIEIHTDGHVMEGELVNQTTNESSVFRQYEKKEEVLEPIYPDDCVIIRKLKEKKASKG